MLVTTNKPKDNKYKKFEKVFSFILYINNNNIDKYITDKIILSDNTSFVFDVYINIKNEIEMQERDFKNLLNISEANKEIE